MKPSSLGSGKGGETRGKTKGKRQNIGERKNSCDHHQLGEARVTK